MVTIFKYVSGISTKTGDITSEATITIEGIPKIDYLKSKTGDITVGGIPEIDFLNAMMYVADEKLKEKRAFNYQFEIDSSVEVEEHEVQDESSELTHSNLEVKAQSSDLDIKLENKIKSDIMYR